MFATLLAGATLVVGGVGFAQSTATPDTGSTINGLSTGNGRGRTGSGQGQSGTTRQNEGSPSNRQRGAGPANTSEPVAGQGGQGASRPSTGEPRPSGVDAQ